MCQPHFQNHAYTSARSNLANYDQRVVDLARKQIAIEFFRSNFSRSDGVVSQIQSTQAHSKGLEDSLLGLVRGVTPAIVNNPELHRLCNICHRQIETPPVQRLNQIQAGIQASQIPSVNTHGRARL